MPHSLNLRAARPDDAHRLAALALQVWLHTYATEGVTEEIARYVLAEFTASRFEALVADTQVDLLVAERGPSLVGYALVRHATPCPAGAAASVELETLYVQEHCMGQGIGKALLQEAHTQARCRAGSRLWLTVNAQNARAIAFYARQGYSKVGTSHFVLGAQRHENHVLLGPDTAAG